MRKIILYILISVTFVSCAEQEVPSDDEALLMFAAPLMKDDGECPVKECEDKTTFRIVTYASYAMTNDPSALNNMANYMFSQSGLYEYDKQYNEDKNKQADQYVLRPYYIVDGEKKYIEQKNVNAENANTIGSMPGKFYIFYISPADAEWQAPEDKSYEKMQKSCFTINPTASDFNFKTSQWMDPIPIGGYGVLDISKRGSNTDEGSLDNANLMKQYRSKLRFRFYQKGAKSVDIVDNSVRLYGAGTDKNPKVDVELCKAQVRECEKSSYKDKKFRTFAVKPVSGKKNKDGEEISYESGDVFVASGLYGNRSFRSGKLGGMLDELLFPDINLAISFDIRMGEKQISLPPVFITDDKLYKIRPQRIYTFDVYLDNEVVTIKLAPDNEDWEDVDLSQNI